MEEWNEILTFNNKYFPEWRKSHPIYYSNALAGETGEVCNLIKKLMGGGTKKNKVEVNDVSEECVDVFIYLVLLLEDLGFSRDKFAEAFKAKMLINTQRMELASNANQEMKK